VGVLLHNKGDTVARDLNGYVHIGGIDSGIQIHDEKNFQYYQSSLFSGMKVGYSSNPNFMLGIEQEVQPLVLLFNITEDYSSDILVKILVNCKGQQTLRAEKYTKNTEIREAFTKFKQNVDFDIGRVLLPGSNDTVE
jgi:hypothetical protein